MATSIPPWLGLLVAAVVFAVIFSLGLMLGREQIAAALRQRGVPLAGSRIWRCCRWWWHWS